MKHQFLPLFILSLIVAGCAATKPEPTSDQPELIRMTSLPTISANYSMNGLKLNVLFHIRNDGSVSEVKLMKSSGDPDWDRAAIDSMKLWQFTSYQPDRPDAERWIRNAIILQVQEPTVLTLGNLIAGSQQEADSLYALLQNGSDFETLSRQIAPGSTLPRGKFIGAVDIARYPKHVRDALQKLLINQITRPLRIGAQYYIYKRFVPDGSDMPQ